MITVLGQLEGRQRKCASFDIRNIVNSILTVFILISKQNIAY